jgi:acyl-CoA dehydrogenase
MFEFSKKSIELQGKIKVFMDKYVYPNEENIEKEINKGNIWEPSNLIEELKQKAKTDGLWNLFLPESDKGAGLSNLDYAPLCEVMGRSPFAPEVFNCNAPDTGNMEVFERYGTEELKEEWLKPLLNGEIRSAFAMTEPNVASSDATNIESSIVRDKDEYIINGEKWWTSGAMDPRCKVLIFMGKTDPQNSDKHKQQSQIVVPMESEGIKIERHLPVFGFSDAPHGHAQVSFKNVRVPKENLLLGEGRGFEIAQGRLGPGRIHHCMRLIGLCEVALEKMCKRSKARIAFGQPVSMQTVTQERIAEARIAIDQIRLQTFNAAHKMDKFGNKEARMEIAMIKVAAPNIACKIIDWAIQVHGGGGVSNDFGLAQAYAQARLLRLADGPDEVHRNQIAKLELRKYN